MFSPMFSPRWLQLDRYLFPGLAVLLGLLLILAYGPSSGNSAVSDLSASFSTQFRRPLSFIPNVGQSDPAVQFAVQAGSSPVLFTEDGFVFFSVNDESTETAALHFIGAKTTEIQGQHQLPGIANFLKGNNPDEWHTEVPTYGAVSYENVFPGVDVNFSGRGGQLALTFQLEDGQDLSQIAWQFEGGTAGTDPNTGNLLVNLEGGDSYLQMSRPQLWQTINGQDVPLALHYSSGIDGQIGFETGETIMAGPAAVTVSMLLPGISGQDYSSDIAIDNVGNVYVTGNTTSDDFPVQNPIQNYAGIWDVFVSKFSADGSTLLYSTFLGGSDNDWGGSIAVDENGLAFLSGSTYSSDFPTANPYQANMNGIGDVFISVLTPNGTALQYSTFFGGSMFESGNEIIPKNNFIYLTGRTNSNDFPIQNAVQPNLGGDIDAFIMQLDVVNNSLLFSSFLGGISNDGTGGLAVTSSGNVILVGGTSSADFPTMNPIQPNYHGNGDIFITAISANGSSFLYSTFLGGMYGDWASSVAVDGSGNVHLAGFSNSPDFPLVNPFPVPNPYDGDAAIVTISPDGSTLLYSALLGGSSPYETADEIALDANGNKYLVGYTESPDFPLQNPIQSTLSGSLDIFVTKLDTNNNIVFSTYLGGSESDQGQGIVVDGAQNIFITGDTFSMDFPTLNAFQPGYAGGAGDVVVAKIDGANYVLDFSTYLGGGPYPGNPTAVSLTDFDQLPGLSSSLLYLGALLVLVFLVGAILIRYKNRKI